MRAASPKVGSGWRGTASTRRGLSHWESRPTGTGQTPPEQEPHGRVQTGPTSLATSFLSRRTSGRPDYSGARPHEHQTPACQCPGLATPGPTARPRTRAPARQMPSVWVSTRLEPVLPAVTLTRRPRYAPGGLPGAVTEHRPDRAAGKRFTSLETHRSLQAQASQPAAPRLPGDRG